MADVDLHATAARRVETIPVPLLGTESDPGLLANARWTLSRLAAAGMPATGGFPVMAHVDCQGSRGPALRKCKEKPGVINGMVRPPGVVLKRSCRA
jgi:hypothetical protein